MVVNGVSIVPLVQVVRQVKKGVAADVPPLGRILLQTGTQDSAKFQEAVAEALAYQLQARRCMPALHPYKHAWNHHQQRSMHQAIAGGLTACGTLTGNPPGGG